MSTSSYTEDQRDCLQEVCNIAMGRAGDALARQFGTFIKLSIPAVTILSADEASELLQHYKPCIYTAGALNEPVEGEPDAELSGLGAVIFSESTLDELSSLVKDQISQQGLITATSRLLARNCLEAMSELIKTDVKCQPFKLVESDQADAAWVRYTSDWSRVLMVDINYQMENREFKGDLLLLFPDEAIDAMEKRLNELVF